MLQIHVFNILSFVIWTQLKTFKNILKNNKFDD